MSALDLFAALKPLCSEDPDRERLASPFAIVFENRKWACGTNGHCLAALPFDGELRTDGPDAAKEIPTGKPTHTATLAALREWAGTPVMEECPQCGGEKKRTGHDCDLCGGKGELPKLRYGALLDGVLNRDLLRNVLDSAPEGTTEIAIAHEGPMAAFAFRVPDWIGLVMPITRTA
jgi:hypothetical protein